MPIACGADSVASALHLRLGATPRGPGQTIMTLRASRQKAELLILHKTGTSHFALTQCAEYDGCLVTAVAIGCTMKISPKGKL